MPGVRLIVALFSVAVWPAWAQVPPSPVPSASAPPNPFLLDPEERGGPLFYRTSIYLARHPHLDLVNAGPWENGAMLRARMNRLTDSTAELPLKLYRDFLEVLESSKRQYQASRIIVWTSALTVLGMLFGLILHFKGLFLLGALLFSAVVLFQLITLPVEYDATRRAKKVAFEQGLVLDQEREGMNKVLDAAALTYVAAAISSLATLLYFLMRSGLLGGRR